MPWIAAPFGLAMTDIREAVIPRTGYTRPVIFATS